MFELGYFPDGDDKKGVEDCEDACFAKETCDSYTFYSIYDPDETWTAHCMGKTDQDTAFNQDLYGYSGRNSPCSALKRVIRGIIGLNLE